MGRFDVLLVNINDLKKHSYIDANVEEQTLRVAAQHVQRVIIEDVIGSCLFDTLADAICTGAISNDAHALHRELLDDYLRPIFAFAVPAEVAAPLSFKIRSAGVIRGSSDDKINATGEEVADLSNKYSANADFYINKAVEWLKCHFDEFPELKDCGCGWCSNRGLKSSSTCPLFL